jgi:hypothetical protein
VTLPLPVGAGSDAGPAPELSFAVESAGALELAAVPTLRIELRIESRGGVPVRSVALETQIRIAATQRSYGACAQERLVELFGRPEQWGASLRSLHWTNVVAHVPAFSHSTRFDLLVPCSYDFELAAARYFDALEDGEVPLELLFSGTVFYTGQDGRLQITRISWERDARCRLPVAVWKAMMERHFGDSAFLRLRKGTLDRLQAYKARNTLLTFEDAINSLLREAERGG